MDTKLLTQGLTLASVNVHNQTNVNVDDLLQCGDFVSVSEANSFVNAAGVGQVYCAQPQEQDARPRVRGGTALVIHKRWLPSIKLVHSGNHAVVVEIQLPETIVKHKRLRACTRGAHQNEPESKTRHALQPSHEQAASGVRAGKKRKTRKEVEASPWKEPFQSDPTENAEKDQNQCLTLQEQVRNETHAAAATPGSALPSELHAAPQSGSQRSTAGTAEPKPKPPVVHGSMRRHGSRRGWRQQAIAKEMIEKAWALESDECPQENVEKGTDAHAARNKETGAPGEDEGARPAHLSEPATNFARVPREATAASPPSPRATRESQDMIQETLDTLENTWVVPDDQIEVWYNGLPRKLLEREEEARAHKSTPSPDRARIVTLVAAYVPARQHKHRRAVAVREIIQHAQRAAIRGQLILMGDLNTAFAPSDRSTGENPTAFIRVALTLKALLPNLVDAMRVGAPKSCHPVHTYVFPHPTEKKLLTCRLDYIFISRDLLSQLRVSQRSTRARPQIASDHRVIHLTLAARWVNATFRTLREERTKLPSTQTERRAQYVRKSSNRFLPKYVKRDQVRNFGENMERACVTVEAEYAKALAGARCYNAPGELRDLISHAIFASITRRKRTCNLSENRMDHTSAQACEESTEQNLDMSQRKGLGRRAISPEDTYSERTTEMETRKRATERAATTLEPTIRGKGSPNGKLATETDTRVETSERVPAAAKSSAREETPERATTTAGTNTREETSERATTSAGTSTRAETAERVTTAAKTSTRAETSERVTAAAKTSTRAETSERVTAAAKTSTRAEASERVTAAAKKSTRAETSERATTTAKTGTRAETSERATTTAKTGTRAETSERATTTAGTSTRAETAERVPAAAKTDTRAKTSERATTTAGTGTRAKVTERAGAAMDMGARTMSLAGIAAAATETSPHSRDLTGDRLRTETIMPTGEDTRPILSIRTSQQTRKSTLAQPRTTRRTSIRNASACTESKTPEKRPRKERTECTSEEDGQLGGSHSRLCEMQTRRHHSQRNVGLDPLDETQNADRNEEVNQEMSEWFLDIWGEDQHEEPLVHRQATPTESAIRTGTCRVHLTQLQTRVRHASASQRCNAKRPRVEGNTGQEPSTLPHRSEERQVRTRESARNHRMATPSSPQNTADWTDEELEEQVRLEAELMQELERQVADEENEHAEENGREPRNPARKGSARDATDQSLGAALTRNDGQGSQRQHAESVPAGHRNVQPAARKTPETPELPSEHLVQEPTDVPEDLGGVTRRRLVLTEDLNPPREVDVGDTDEEREYAQDHDYNDEKEVRGIGEEANPSIQGTEEEPTGPDKTFFEIVREIGMRHKLPGFRASGSDYTDPILAQKYYQTIFSTENTPTVSHELHAFFAKFNPLAKITHEHLKMLETRITRSEVRDALARFNTRSAPGPDGVPPLVLAEILKSSDTMANAFADLANQIVQHGVMPRSWQEGVLRTIPKVGKVKGPVEHTRPIILMQAARRLFGSIISERLQPILASLLLETQMGFLKGKGPLDAITRILQCVANAKSIGQLYTNSAKDRLPWLRRKNRKRRTPLKPNPLPTTDAQGNRNCPPVFVLLVDLEKAYDTIRPEYILEQWKSAGIPTNIAYLMANSVYMRLAIENAELPRFLVKARGVPQGDPLAPLLFITKVDTIGRAVLKWAPGAAMPARRDMEIVMYADDITVICRYAEDIVPTMDTIHRAASIVGMKVNLQKCTLLAMHVPREQHGQVAIQYAGTLRVSPRTIPQKERDWSLLSERILGAHIHPLEGGINWNPMWNILRMYLFKLRPVNAVRIPYAFLRYIIEAIVYPKAFFAAALDVVHTTDVQDFDKETRKIIPLIIAHTHRLPAAAFEASRLHGGLELTLPSTYYFTARLIQIRVAHSVDIPIWNQWASALEWRQSDPGEPVLEIASPRTNPQQINRLRMNDMDKALVEWLQSKRRNKPLPAAILQQAVTDSIDDRHNESDAGAGYLVQTAPSSVQKWLAPRRICWEDLPMYVVDNRTHALRERPTDNFAFGTIRDTTDMYNPANKIARRMYATLTQVPPPRQKSGIVVPDPNEVHAFSADVDKIRLLQSFATFPSIMPGDENSGIAAWRQIATDASWTSSGAAGIAAVTETESWAAPVVGAATPTETEILAINMAMAKVLQREVLENGNRQTSREGIFRRRLIIISDSQQAIKLLQTPHTLWTARKLASSTEQGALTSAIILQTLLQTRWQIETTFLWTKSHSGVFCNEYADQTAKNACATAKILTQHWLDHVWEEGLGRPDQTAADDSRIVKKDTTWQPYPHALQPHSLFYVGRSEFRILSGRLASLMLRESRAKFKAVEWMAHREQPLRTFRPTTDFDTLLKNCNRAGNYTSSSSNFLQRYRKRSTSQDLTQETSPEDSAAENTNGPRRSTRRRTTTHRLATGTQEHSS